MLPLSKTVSRTAFLASAGLIMLTFVLGMTQASSGPVDVKVKVIDPKGDVVEGIQVRFEEFTLGGPGGGKKDGKGADGKRGISLDQDLYGDTAFEHAPDMLQAKAAAKTDKDGMLKVKLKPAVYRWQAGVRGPGKLFASGIVRIEAKDKDKVHEFKLRQF